MSAGKIAFTHDFLAKWDKNIVNYINTDPYIVSSNIRRHAVIDSTYENEDHHFKMSACHPAAYHLGALERDVQMARDGLDFYTIDAH